MKYSHLFSHTLRDNPSGAQVLSHQLLVRAGYIQQLAAGIFTLMPLGLRVLHKIEDIVREEMDAIGGQEIKMPVVHPASLWKETGRWYEIGSEMGRFKDRIDRDMVLAMTHEEVVTDLARNQIQSFSQLPVLLYHIQTKWRDEARPRAGLIRVREFTMKDSYSLDTDVQGLDTQYRAHYQAYFNIFNRCGLEAIAVSSDPGMMGGTMAHEYMVLTPSGEDTLCICEKCGYQANRQIATFTKSHLPDENMLSTKLVATPGISSISDLCEFLHISSVKTAKAVFMVANIIADNEEREKLIFAVIRGDMEVNETKLLNAVKAQSLRPATEEEIRAIGAEPGYASPIDILGVTVVVDDSIVSTRNLVGGANKAGYHMKNLNYERDFTADIVSDIATAQEGDACPQCGSPLVTQRGIEVGNIFKLGTRYSAAMGATYKTEDGEMRPIVMGSYGIGIGRLMACVAEINNDEFGLIWPISIAPYQVHLIALGPPDSKSKEVADDLYLEMKKAGIDVLYDDRNRSPGVKFNDADLIGIPLRLTIAKRGLSQNSAELKQRDKKEREWLPLPEVIATVQGRIATLKTSLSDSIKEMPFRI
jgi:prolyl-tRNA synthetase